MPKIAANHFGEEALQFFRNFLSGALKDGKHCRLGVILEFKTPKIPARASQKRIDALLAAAAREALGQIEERRYAEEMERELAERDPQPFNLSTTIP